MSSPPVAVHCADVDMEFPLASEISWWRLVTGLPADAPRVRALSGVSLDVPKGEIVGVIGKNGAGKSTLLRVLGKVFHPTRGEVRTAGSVARLVRARRPWQPALERTRIRDPLSPHHGVCVAARCVDARGRARVFGTRHRALSGRSAPIRAAWRRGCILRRRPRHATMSI